MGQNYVTVTLCIFKIQPTTTFAVAFIEDFQNCTCCIFAYPLSCSRAAKNYLLATRLPPSVRRRYRRI